MNKTVANPMVVPGWHKVIFQVIFQWESTNLMKYVKEFSSFQEIYIMELSKLDQIWLNNCETQ